VLAWARITASLALSRRPLLLLGERRPDLFAKEVMRLAMTGLSHD
jgi:hypothetical protein